MKICIVTQFFSPDITAAAFRMSETAAWLQNQGHDIRVITSHPHKALTTDIDPLSVFDESKVLRTHLSPVGKGGLIRYLIHYLSFLVGGISLGILLRFKSWKPDIIWATSPPLFAGICGVVLARLYRCPITLDIRDIWPDSAVSAGQLNSNGRAYRFARKLEIFLYSQANALTCVSNPMASYLSNLTATPVHVIYNGINPNEKTQSRIKNTFNRIVYAGNLGRVQGLEMLISSFQEFLREELFEGWEVVLVGTGANEDALKNIAYASSLHGRVHFLPPMSKSATTHYLSESAILFLNLKDDDVFALTIPSKVFDYMLVGRPILAGIIGEGRDILDSTGGNICFRPSDSASFSKSLRKILVNLSYYQSRAEANYEFVVNRFRRDEQAQKLNEVLAMVKEGL